VTMRDGSGVTFTALTKWFISRF